MAPNPEVFGSTPQTKYKSPIRYLRAANQIQMFDVKAALHLILRLLSAATMADTQDVDLSAQMANLIQYDTIHNVVPQDTTIADIRLSPEILQFIASIGEVRAYLTPISCILTYHPSIHL